MSWISKLCETYDNNSANVLSAQTLDDLLPICHSSNNAQIEVTLDEKGTFLEARVLDKEEAVTIIPVTEDSAAARTSGLTPHPLFDKLQYIAGDYKEYVETKKESGYQLYIDSLTKWVNSSFSHPMVLAIYRYLEKKSVIKDLIREKILWVDSAGKIMEDWKEEGEKPKIFSIATTPSEAFVRFRVEIPGIPDSRVWLNKDVRKQFIDFYMQGLEKSQVCYVSGELSAPARKIPGKIRNTGDSAKLISSNDNSGFTFRGRAMSADQAVSVGFESAQKSVNALKWLISKQGYHNGDQVIIAWGTQNEMIPQPLSDADQFFGNTPNEITVENTHSEYALRLKKKIAGYATKLPKDSSIVVMGLDSTNGNKGRLSITYYRELLGSEFLQRIEHWYATCCWYPLRYSAWVENEKKKKEVKYCGTPSPSDIALAAYGSKIDDLLKKATIERLLPCIVDGTPIPREIIHMVTERISNPVAMETWEWNRSMGVACAVIRKYYNDLEKKKTNAKTDRERWTMDMNVNENDRSYLFGRLLAYARRIEEYSLYVGKATPRQTNAERSMSAFKRHPMKTWEELYQRLLPYMSRFRSQSMNSLGNKYESEMNGIMTQLKTVPNGYTNENLSPLYLLGYQSQMNVFDKEIEELRAKRAEEKNNGD